MVWRLASSCVMRTTHHHQLTSHHFFQPPEDMTHTQTHEMPSVRLAGVIALLWVQLCLGACARRHAYPINPSFFMNPSFCSLAGGVCLLGVEKVAYPHAISIAAKIWRENEVK